MFGGERNAEQDENAEPKHGQAADSDDELEFLNELSLLAPDLSLWVPVTINGERQAQLSL